MNEKFYQIINQGTYTTTVMGNFRRLKDAQSYCKERYGINSWEETSTGKFKQGNYSSNTAGFFYIQETSLIFND